MTRPDERAANLEMNDYAAELSERMPLDEVRAEFAPFVGLKNALVLMAVAFACSWVLYVLGKAIRAWAASRGML